MIDRERIIRYILAKCLFHLSSFPKVPGMPYELRKFDKYYDETTGAWDFSRLKPFKGWLPIGYDLVGPDAPVTYGPVEREVGHFLFSLVMMYQPNRILETGTHIGYATTCMASALEQLGGDRQVVTIDPVNNYHLWNRSHLDKRVRWMAKTSQEAAPSLKEQTFDMLFLDSEHKYKTVSFEIEHFEPLLKVNGLMIFHDCLYFDGVGLAVKQLMDHPRFSVVFSETPRKHKAAHIRRRPGLAIVQKLSEGPQVKPLEDKLHWGLGDDRTPAYLHRIHNPLKTAERGQEAGRV